MTAPRSRSAAGHGEPRSTARSSADGCGEPAAASPLISSDPAPCGGHGVTAGPSISSHYQHVNRPRSKRFTKAVGLYRIELSNETGGLKRGRGVKRKQKTGDSLPILLLGAAPYFIKAPISPFSPQSTCLFAPRAPGAALATCRTFPSEHRSLSRRPTPAHPRRTRASELPLSGIHPVLPIWGTAASSASRTP